MISMKKLYLSIFFLVTFFIQGNAQCTVIITGQHCEGSTLKASTTGNRLLQLQWMRDSTTVDTSTIHVPFFQNAVTVAGGNGYGSAPNQFAYPSDVFVDKMENIYVSDPRNHRIQKWTPDAIEGITVAGGNGEGSAPNQLDLPTAVFVDESGNIFISDNNNSRIQKWTSGASEGITVAGGNGYGSGLNQIAEPQGIFVDSFGALYVPEYDDNRIVKWLPGASEGIIVAGGNGKGDSSNQFNGPSDIFIDKAGNLYIADDLNHRIQRWAPGAKEGVTVAGGNGKGKAANQLNRPQSVVVDDLFNVYIADFFNNRIQKWAPGDTTGITVAGHDYPGNGPDELREPEGIFFDASNRLFVTDAINSRIQEFLPDSANAVAPDSTLVTKGGGAFSAKGIFENDCSAVSNTINVTGLPEFSRIEGQKRNLCGGGIFTYSVASISGASGYQWSVPSEAVIVSGQGTNAITLNIPSSFIHGEIKISAANNCGRGLAFVDTITTKPFVPALISGSDSVQAGEQNLSYSTISEPGIQYTWSVPKDAQIISGQGTNAITVNWGFRSGNVFARAFTCGDTASRLLHVTIIAAMANKLTTTSKQSSSFKVYPNPANDQVTIEYTSAQTGNYTLQLTDMKGRVLQKKQGVNLKGVTRISLGLSAYGKGVYVLQLTDAEGKIVYAKLVKQ